MPEILQMICMSFESTKKHQLPTIELQPLSVRTIPIISLGCTPKGWRIALFLCIYRCVCVCDWLAEKHWKIVVFELPQNPFPKSSSSALTRSHSLRRWCCRCVTKNSDLIPMTSTMSGIPANLLQLSWRTSTQDCLRPQTTIAGRKTTTAAAFVSARKTTKRLMMRLRQLGTTNRRQQEHRMPRLATDDASAIRQVPWDVQRWHAGLRRCDGGIAEILMNCWLPRGCWFENELEHCLGERFIFL